ncbi:ATP-dependent helicase [Rhodococcus sp. SG20037]|uniref:ATP-dependent helicase n=1 Tax=Rhodococcus sp. SG20037 TaxID=3074148 RepID=UPI00287FC755|nr:ATP-dependent helicase [Rhodococcus sp. SG20037]WNF44430.1 ATP-dependent helicase [Rhodococcus sp. SG20037]
MPLTWEIGALTDEQTLAIETPGNVFLVACPGSGKTRTLAYKVASELSDLDSRKKFVIAITYTNKAAYEIEDRIATLGVDTEQLWIGTIHSFCLEWIIKPYSVYHPDLAGGFSVINSYESEEIIKELCSKKGLSIYDCGFYYTGSGYELACLDQSKHAKIKAVLATYFEELKFTNQLDFESILKYAHELMQNNPSIAKILSSIFEFIAVDEYQDTKLIQYEILASIISAGQETPRSFIVGDPNQEIFSSLGGYAMDSKELSTLTQKPYTLLKLSKNFRSSARIVSYFENFSTESTTMVAASPERDYPSEITLNQTIEVDNLAGEIARLVNHSVKDLGIEQSEICILAPWWIHLASMTRTLVQNLPEYEFDGPGLVPFDRDRDNFWYKVAKIALTHASPEMYVRRLRWANDVLSELDACGADVSGLHGRDYLRASNSLDLDENNGIAYLRTYFESIMQLLKIDYRLFTTLTNQHSAFFASSEARVNKLVNEGNAYVQDIEVFRRVFRDRTGITVSTIHGVKGGEFDTVIAYGLLHDIVPHFADPSPIDSANKLLYVLSSRARKNLHLIAERRTRRFGSYETSSPLKNISYIYDTN